jgi:hypothetical protein
MGQAKLRGNQEQRIAQAQKRMDELRPAFVICNHCQSEITEIFPMDTKGMKGIEAVFGGYCTTCHQDTWAIKGDPDAVADFCMALESTTDGEVKLGAVPSKI